MKLAVNFELDDLLLKHFQAGTTPPDLAEYLRQIIRRLAAAGVDQVNWRATVGGKAVYHSKVLQVFDGWYYRYSELEGEFLERHDPLAIVAAECREQGISPWCWIDAFDSYVPGMQETMFERHPSWLLWSRDGNTVLPGVPCYANPRVREYRLRHIREMADYGIGGILYSLFNSHATPFLVAGLGGGENAEPYSFGFNPEIVEAYERRYGKNILRETFDVEAWGRLQGEQFGDYLKEVRDLLAARGQELDLVIRRDNHCAGSLYPRCYIGNTYQDWFARGACTALTIEGVQLPEVLEESAAMAARNPEIPWGLWHTLWAQGVTPEKTTVLLERALAAGRFAAVTLHEVDALEFGVQTGGSRDEAYRRLTQWATLVHAAGRKRPETK